LYIGPAGALYVARGYEIHRSDDWGKTWRLDCFIPLSGRKAWAVRARWVARLLRYDIMALQVLPNGTRVAVACDGLYRAAAGETRMSRVFRITRGSRPLNLTWDGTRLLFGEYGRKLKRCEVLIYVSEDGGETFCPGFRFPRGDIQHVHNLLVDPYQPDGYWVLVGDWGRCPGIGRLSRDLRTLDWVQRGSQTCRAVGGIVAPDGLVYGMDSELERNYIVRLDRQSGKITRLLDVGGSSFYAATFGSVRLISTSTEPNPSFDLGQCALYASLDGVAWNRIMAHHKDWWNSDYFQYGTLVLPYAYHDQPRGMFSGQAVAGLDDRCRLIEFADDREDQVPPKQKVD
jgi:hypothetical protein